MEGGQAIVEVEDTGPGITADRILHLFHPFFTTKEGGMGMGLAISQTIVENHDGRIWAESEPGTGSTFYVSLPLAQADTPDATVAGKSELLESLT